jgi:hypothetical protein
VTISVITNPGSASTCVSGFRGARLLRQQQGREVPFTPITFFTSVDAVRGLAGDDYERAVAEEAARQVLTRRCRWERAGRTPVRRRCRCAISGAS